MLKTTIYRENAKLKGTKIAVWRFNKCQMQPLHLFAKSSQYTRCICLQLSHKSNIQKYSTRYNIKRTYDMFQLNIYINWKELGVKFVAALRAD